MYFSSHSIDSDWETKKKKTTPRGKAPPETLSIADSAEKAGV